MMALSSSSSRRLALGLALVAGAGVSINSASCKASKPERVVVVGAGIMGSATARALSRHPGVQVSLIEAGNPFRSSWGESRIARLSQVDDLHLRMMIRAKEIWDELSTEAGKLLLKPTGMLDIGYAASEKIHAVASTYQQCGVEYEEFLTPEALATRFPQLRLGENECALFNRSGWLVLAADCLESLRSSVAKSPHAVVVECDEVVAIDRERRQVTTEDGLVISYDRLVLCCGPWTNAVLARASPPLSLLPLFVTAEQQTYFSIKPEPPSNIASYSWDALPVMIDRTVETYALPHVDGGVAGLKIAQHQVGPIIANTEDHVLAPGVPIPEFLDRRGVKPALTPELHEASARACSEWAAARMPGVESDEVLHHYRCMYTMTPDRAFVLGPHPDEPERIVVVGGFNGEGFKFAPVIGEAAASIVLGLPEPVKGMRARFDPGRFGG